MVSHITTEQRTVLQSFQSMCASPHLRSPRSLDVRASHSAIVFWFKQVEKLGVADALTPSEMAQANQSRAFLLYR